MQRLIGGYLSCRSGTLGLSSCYCTCQVAARFWAALPSCSTSALAAASPAKLSQGLGREDLLVSTRLSAEGQKAKFSLNSSLKTCETKTWWKMPAEWASLGLQATWSGTFGWPLTYCETPRTTLSLHWSEIRVREALQVRLLCSPPSPPPSSVSHNPHMPLHLILSTE